MPKAKRVNSTSGTDARRIREIAALDFKPVFKPGPGFLRPFSDDTFAKLGKTARTAILLLSANKSQLVRIAADQGEDAWFCALEDIHGANEILAEISKLLETAHARGLAAAAVMASPSPRSS
jgi:hypothetical protein